MSLREDQSRPNYGCNPLMGTKEFTLPRNSGPLRDLKYCYVYIDIVLHIHLYIYIYIYMCAFLFP